MIKHFFLFTLLFFVFTPTVLAQSTEGVITKILEEKNLEFPSGSQLFQKLEVTLKNQSKVVIGNGDFPSSNINHYNQGDQVIVTKEGETYSISDYVRKNSLFLLFLIFIFLTILVARWHGFMALVSVLISFLILFFYTLPKIAAGADPFIVSIITSIVLIPLTFYLSHGISWKTTCAIIGTFISLFITILLAKFFINFSKLNGTASEESGFLSLYGSTPLNLVNLLFAGIVIGTLGVLDDISISQSAVVFQLRQANPHQSFLKLYSSASAIGRDHITSMVNTLILAYVGAAMPLMLLFVHNPRPFSEVVNYEPIAEEIVRSLVGSIGLILTVPITTAISCFIVDLMPHSHDSLK